MPAYTEDYLVTKGWKRTASGRWKHDLLQKHMAEGHRAKLVNYRTAVGFQKNWDAASKATAREERVAVGTGAGAAASVQA